MANCGVFIAMLVLLAVVNGGNKSADSDTTRISPDDEWIFSVSYLFTIINISSLGNSQVSVMSVTLSV